MLMEGLQRSCLWIGTKHVCLFDPQSVELLNISDTDERNFSCLLSNHHPPLFVSAERLARRSFVLVESENIFNWILILIIDP